MKQTINVDWQNGSTPLKVVTTSTGFFRPGIKGRIIGGGEREIFVGTPAQSVVIPEFKLELTHKGKTWVHPTLCQYGRDFVFACQQGQC